MNSVGPVTIESATESAVAGGDGVRARPARYGWLGDLGFCTVLAGFVWFAYAPSLRHAHRADQWCFLFDTMHQHGFLDTLAHSYSYNRTRTISRGDTDLFRPVLFALLSAEKAAFEGNLAAHQAVGIVLHCLVCFLMLTVMRQVAAIGNRPERADSRLRAASAKLLPYGITAFFALNPAIQELVVWSHLSGYLLFLAFVLGSLALVLRYLSSENAGRWASPTLWVAWALALLAAFTHELGQVYAILTGGVFAVALFPKVGARRSLALGGLFVSIVTLYQTINAIDRRIHAGQYKLDHSRKVIQKRALTRLTLKNSGRFATYTSVQPFFPSLLQTEFTEQRWRIAETLWMRDSRRTSLAKLGSMAGVSLLTFAAVIGLTLGGFFQLFRRPQRLPLLVFLLVIGLYGAYAAVTVLGRMNLKLTPPYVLTVNTYYTYFGLLFSLLAISAACQTIDRLGGCVSGARYGLLAGLVALAVFGAFQVRKANATIARSIKEYARPIRVLNDFVEAHRLEPDFSVSISYVFSDPVPRLDGLFITDAVFKRWISTTPKYRIAIRHDGVQVLPPLAVGPGRRTRIDSPFETGIYSTSPGLPDDAGAASARQGP
jgi:hypothetical protein